ncbi:Bcr/CflA family drug resistance efflux transporter [Rhodoblastus sphagnicola]|uniref:Bcr/CflA family efflux transporter n=2 Tax=Rhodoblastus sphagnicola TaxID=333368 RepID=A0A2S6MXA8_9HYPH|nr:Bcr/CflA family drug resistance efflux transporter [Rhodoblastus sphagnicola]
MAFAAISTDLYLPALPAMAVALRAGSGEMEWTISGFLIGFSLGQLVWGPVGDRYGRRAPVALGLVIYSFGSGGCALAATPGQIIGWRIVQALGACAAVVLSRAMVRDLYHGEKAARMMSTLMSVMAIAPLVAPLAGSQILAFASWRAIFWTLVACAAAALAALATLPETLPVARRNKESLRTAFAAYGRLLGDRRILGFASVGALFYVGLFAYVVGSPFAFIVYHGVTPARYALLFGLGTFGIMAANLLNARLIPQFGSLRLLRIGALAAAVSGIAVAVDTRLCLGGLAGLVAPLLVFVASTGLIVANSIAGALAAFPERAGAVSALVGASHYGAGIVGSGLVGALGDGTPSSTPWPMALTIALSGLGCAVCAWTLVSARK